MYQVLLDQNVLRRLRLTLQGYEEFTENFFLNFVGFGLGDGASIRLFKSPANHFEFLGLTLPGLNEKQKQALRDKITNVSDSSIMRTNIVKFIYDELYNHHILSASNISTKMGLPILSCALYAIVAMIWIIPDRRVEPVMQAKE